MRLFLDSAPDEGIRRGYTRTRHIYPFLGAFGSGGWVGGGGRLDLNLDLNVCVCILVHIDITNNDIYIVRIIII